MGYDRIADAVIHLVKQEGLRPLTVGVFGDWGSGKSSILRMAYRSLKADDNYVCVWFNPWLHTEYDEVKSALMVAVLTELRRKRPVLQKVEEAGSKAAVELWRKLARRVDWFRLFGFAAKNVGGLAVAHFGHAEGAAALHLSSLGDLGQLHKAAKEPAREAEAPETFIKDETDEHDVNQVIEQRIDEFRRDFESLLAEVKISSLVVFVDDLDRCLPSNIVDTLEALKLFLAVPRTNFILAADERVVKHAIDLRYPEIGADAYRIGRDYLEKIVQVPLYIPPLTPEETETYLNMLTLQDALGSNSQNFETLVQTAKTNRAAGTLGVAMNLGIAHSHVSGLDASVERSMQLVQSVAPILCSQLEGNPRRIKRFLNTLILRQSVAHTSGVQLETRILAKLMVFEYFYPSFFTQIFKWQLDGLGFVVELKPLEDAVDTGKPEEINKQLKELNLPANEYALQACLKLEPRLNDVNLTSYFYFSRDKIQAPTWTAARLSEELQKILAALRSESDALIQGGITKAAALPAVDLLPVYKALLVTFVQTPDNGSIQKALIVLASKRKELVTNLADTLRQIPTVSIHPSLPLMLATEFKPLLPPITNLIKDWQNSTNRNLREAATKALSRNGHV